MRSRRFLFLGSALIAVLCATDFCCYLVMEEARDLAGNAIRDALACEQLAQHIVTLRRQPMVAVSTFQGQERLSARIETTAHRFGITGDNLAAIDPEPPIRLGNSIYLEKPTVIQLRKVSLGQLINLLCDLERTSEGLKIKSLRMSIPPQNQESGLWTAEVTVAYLVYSPLPQEENHAPL